MGQLFQDQPAGQRLNDQDRLRQNSKKFNLNGRDLVLQIMVPYPAELAPKTIQSRAGIPVTPTPQASRPTEPRPGRGAQSQQQGRARGPEPNPVVQVQTEQGVFTIELFEDWTPNTVANFITLTRSLLPCARIHSASV